MTPPILVRNFPLPPPPERLRRPRATVTVDHIRNEKFRDYYDNSGKSPHSKKKATCDVSARFPSKHEQNQQNDMDTGRGNHRAAAAEESLRSEEIDINAVVSCLLPSSRSQLVHQLIKVTRPYTALITVSGIPRIKGPDTDCRVGSATVGTWSR